MRAKLGKRILASVLSCGMLMTLITLPASNVCAEESTIDLLEGQPITLTQTATADDKGSVFCEQKFLELDKKVNFLENRNIAFEAEVTIDSISTGTGTIVLYGMSSSWDWKDSDTWGSIDSVGVKKKVTVNLSSLSDLNQVGVRIANCTEGATVKYTIHSAKLVGATGGGGAGETGGYGSDYTGSLTYTLPAECVDDAVDTPVSQHGQLHVDMETLKLADENNNLFQLRGISSHGMTWAGNADELEYEYINYDSIKRCRDLLNANAIRLALYADSYMGYTTGGNKSDLKFRVDKGVKIATALGMYAIVDWHFVNQNPNVFKTDAKEFFDYMSKQYANNNNVLYEICNEPSAGIWTDIKSYAEEIIPIIKANDPDAIIIVGTPTWSQDVDIVAENPIKDADESLADNIMYTVHFYAKEHTESYRQKVVAAYGKIPMFCTEYNITMADGDRGTDPEQGTAWLDLLDRYCISYFAWSLCEKREDASLIKNGTHAPINWSETDLSDAGAWVKAQYAARKEVNNVTAEKSEQTFDASNILFELIKRTSNSFVIQVTPEPAAGSAYEYSIDGGETWQASPIFTGLNEVTVYTPTVRLKATPAYYASEKATSTESFSTLLENPYAIDISKLSDETYVGGLATVDAQGNETVTAVFDKTTNTLTLKQNQTYALTGNAPDVSIVADENAEQAKVILSGVTAKDILVDQVAAPSIDPKDPPESDPEKTPTNKPNDESKDKPGKTSENKPDSLHDDKSVQPQSAKATGLAVALYVKDQNMVNEPSVYQLAPKKSVVIQVAFMPENAQAEKLVYQSDNESVVAVSTNGVMTAGKKSGTAKITVTSENGLSKTFSVKVMKKAVSKVKIKAKTKTVKVKRTISLKAELLPSKSKASHNVKWMSADETIATVSSAGKVKGLKKGKVKITAYATDGGGKKATVTIKVK